MKIHPNFAPNVSGWLLFALASTATVANTLKGTQEACYFLEASLSVLALLPLWGIALVPLLFLSADDPGIVENMVFCPAMGVIAGFISGLFLTATGFALRFAWALSWGRAL